MILPAASWRRRGWMRGRAAGGVGAGQGVGGRRAVGDRRAAWRSSAASSQLSPLGLAEGVGRPDPHAVHGLGVVVGAFLVVAGRRRGRSGCRNAAGPHRPASPSGRCSASRRGRAPGRRAGTARPSTASPAWTARRSSSGAVEPANRRGGGPAARRTPRSTPARRPPSTPARRVRASRAAEAPSVVEPVAAAARCRGRRRPRRHGRPGRRTSRRRTTRCAVRRSTNTSRPSGGVAHDARPWPPGAPGRRQRMGAFTHRRSYRRRLAPGGVGAST